MKVLHISTLLTGGASIAGLKIHHDLLAQGIASKFLFLKGDLRPGQQEIYKYSNPVYLKSNRGYLYQTLLHQSLFRLYGLRKRFENFSHPYARYDLIEERLVKEADIIHLHWIAGFVDQPTFFRRINKPVVWTLHDMNPFQGGFHYKNDELFNISALLQRNNIFLRKLKASIFREVEQLTVTAPSEWLLQTSQQSEVLGRFPHYHVPYSIDTSIFPAEDKTTARTELGFPTDNIIFTFLSERLNNKRKGFDLLQQSIRQLMEECNANITIVNIGSGSCDIDGAINTGRISNSRRIAKLLSASDALVLPSREDNFPNVMMEANSCGCPVIAFPVGGMREFIQHGFNGLLAQSVNTEALKSTMKAFIDNHSAFDRGKIRAYVQEQYSPLVQARRYIDIYGRIM